MDAKKFGKRLRDARKGQKMTQEQLAQHVGVSTKYISNIECGDRTPTLDLLVTIANALDTDLNSIMVDSLKCADSIQSNALQQKMNTLPIHQKKKILRYVNFMVEDALANEE